MTRAINPRALKWIEMILWAAGFAALGYCGYIWGQARAAQASAQREFSRPLPSAAAAAPRKLETGDLVGLVEIPRLDLSAGVFEGDSNSVLNRGVGHVSGTALPGQPGNVVLAAHRDTFFRPLRMIRPHDVITVATMRGARRYEVESTEIVNPDQVSVLAPTSTPTLTLVTCYPFEFFGHAPRRFIVRARETGAAETAGKFPDRAGRMLQSGLIPGARSSVG